MRETNTKRNGNKASRKGKTASVALVFVYCLMGFAIGFFAAFLDQSYGLGPWSFVFILVMLGVSVFLTPLIHEAGHLVLGLLTGYEFVSFRVGSLTLVKENGRLVRRRFQVSGTGGQCILTCPKVEDPLSVPYFWYNFGGVFFNFLTALLCLPVGVFVQNPYVRLGAATLGIVSLVLGCVNVVPTKAMGVGTDGYNIVLLKNSPMERAAFYKTLQINAKLYQGVRLEELPERVLSFSEEEKNTTLGTALSILEASLLVYRHEFEPAEYAYRRIAETDGIYELYKNECDCEILFCMIMNGCSKEEIDDFYDDHLKRYIAVTGKTYITRKRLLYAYELLVNKDMQKAAKELELAQKMEKTYPARGEYLSEMDLISYISERNRNDLQNA